MNRIVLFLLACMLFSCARKNVFDEPPDHPVIDSIAPASGTTGTQLRLYGSGFSVRPSLHTVTINGVPVQVDSPSTSTVLLVTVTSKTGTGIVHVKVNNKEADGPVFTYVDVLDPPVITKAYHSWNDGSGYALNVRNLPATDNGIKLTVNGTQVTIDHITRPGHPRYNANEGEQLLIGANGTVESQVPLNLADFIVTCNNVPSQPYRLVLTPRITQVSPAQAAANDILTLTGVFFGDRSLPSRSSIEWQGNTLSPDPEIVSWTNTQIQLRLPSYPTITPDAGGPAGYADVSTAVTVSDKRSASLHFLYRTISNNLIVSTFSGSGTRGYLDGAAAVAQFRTVWGIAIDYSGNIILGDGDNNRIRRISTAGAVSTMAGSGTAGFADGFQNVAQFYNPLGVATRGTGTSAAVYVADVVNHRIRYIGANGSVSTQAGTGTSGYADGTSATAQFARPMAVAVNTQGVIYVADMDNHCIRSITPGGIVGTLAGNGTIGFADGTGTTARFSSPFGVAADLQGNVYVADYGNFRIRKITPGGVVTTLAGGNSGYQDGVGTAARFSSPRGVAVDAQGNVYVADAGNHRIRKITPDGTVTTLAGSTQGYADGPALQARFDTPTSIAVDPQGNIYVADAGNFRVRKISTQ